MIDDYLSIFFASLFIVLTNKIRCFTFFLLKHTDDLRLLESRMEYQKGAAIRSTTSIKDLLI